MFTTYAVKDPMRSKDNINITDIDHELSKLWESLEASNKIRACLFNLVLYTDDHSRTAHFKELVKQIIDTLPCRIIFIRGDHDTGQDFLRTGVTALTSGHGDQMVACDQITIDAGGSFIKRVPFVVTPHIVPDLPVYLIWGQDPSTEGEILPHLEKYATRLIFDSECSENLQSFASTVIEHLEKVNTEVADLNWAKVKGWRDVITQIFQTPEKIYELSNAKQINITFNGKICDTCRHPDVQALYLQGWLASRLNWRQTGCEKSEGNYRLTYQTPGGDLVVIVHPTEVEDLPSGCIMEVKIESHGQHRFDITREKLTRMVRVHVESPEHCEIPYTLLLSSMQRGQQMMKEIFYEPSSEHYLAMLRSVATLTLET